MEFVINGDTIEVKESVRTVADLLDHFDLDKKRAIVELNAAILEKSSYGETALSDGDKIEIVHFVGGG